MRTYFAVRVLHMTFLGLLAAGCSNLPQHPADVARPDSDIRLALVDRARWSMSAHNMQPWEVELDPADPLVLRVYLANDRLLPASDPRSRQILMSVGGFLALLVDIAAAGGRTAEVALFPQGELSTVDGGKDFELPVAEVRLSGGSVPADPGYLDALSSATVKSDLGTLDIPAVTRSALLSLNTYDDVRVEILGPGAELEAMKPILKDAFRLEMGYLPTLEESYDLTRRNNRQIRVASWGLSYRSIFRRGRLGWVELAETLFPMKKEKWGVVGADRFDKEVDRAGTILIIRTADSSRHAQIRAGMVFQRTWAQAVHLGYAVLPASQALQEYAAMSDLYGKVHQVFAEPGEIIQMIAVLGLPGIGYLPGFRLPTASLLLRP